jgi:hypothetical protein
MPAIKEQTTLAEARLLNSNFVEKIRSGHIKEAAELGSDFIREKVRETGFLNQILPRTPVMDSELDRDENTDLPKIVIDKEEDSTATYIPFRASADNHYFTGKRFAVFFIKVESAHFSKNIFELKTYRHDVRRLLKDNSIKDIQEQEDVYFLEGVDAAIAASPASGFQSFTISGGLTPVAVKLALQALTQLRRRVGVILMTDTLYADLLTFDVNQVGFQLKGEWFTKGVPTPKSFFGVPVVTTIKNDIVPDNVFYVFAEPEMLGKNYSLQEPTLFIKEEADLISFWTYESIGVGIGNLQSIIKVTL